LSMTPKDRGELAKRLPPYLRDVFAFACENGTRKGQLFRTRRAYVDLEGEWITYPPGECKAEEEHGFPLVGESLAIVTRALAEARPWCPYVWHGPRCAPGRKPSRDYGCLGYCREAWEEALKAAGMPVGRKVGGYVFHHTRNTATTDLRAGGMKESAAMRITGHQTRAVFDWYNLGEPEALRDELRAARDMVRVRQLKKPSITAGAAPTSEKQGAA